MALPLTEKLLKEEPLALARNEAEPKRGGSNENTKKTQIRKFYDDFVLLQKKADASDDFGKSILPLIKFSEAKLAYACARGNISDVLRKSLVDYIDKIQTKEDFDNFLLFYQAFIAYYNYELEQAKKINTGDNRSNPNNTWRNKK